MKRALLISLCIVLSTAAAVAQKTKSKPTQKPRPNQVKGQGQLNGGAISFGTVYSLKNGFNFQILSGHYTLEPFDAYGVLYPKADEKILVLDIAIKNARPSDNWFSSEGLFNLVDSDGNTYTMSPAIMLTSKGREASSFTLKPGQGLGQPAMNDPLQVAWTIPAKAKITKIMLTQGRLNTSEEVLRYLLVEPPKADAAVKDKNFIAALPAESRVDGDSWGAVLAPESRGAIGKWMPSGAFDLKLDKVTESSDTLMGGSPPEEGKRFVIMNVTCRNMTTAELTLFEVTGGDFPTFAILDADGEKYRPAGYKKVSTDEDAERALKKGESYTMRVFFQLPKDAKIKHMVVGSGGYVPWGIDPS